MKWLKLLLLIPLLLILAGIWGYKEFTSDPEDLKVFHWDSNQRVSLANEIRTPISYWLDRYRSHYTYATAPRPYHGDPDPTTRPPQQQRFTFTEEQLNAFLQQWGEEKPEWKDKAGKYISDPAILLQDGQFVLRARVNELSTVLSLYIKPTIDDHGLLHMDIVKRTGGKLPLPGAVVDGQLARLKGPLSAKLPEWRRQAKLENGAFNDAAADAAMAQLLVGLIEAKGVPPMFFIPIDEHRHFVPVRLSELRLEKEHVTLIVDPVPAEERQPLLDKITTP